MGLPRAYLENAADSGCERLLPYRLLEHFRMLPVQFVAATRIFCVAFCDGIDYTALYAIEQMLDCRTEPCLISRSSMDRELERMGHEARAGDLLFESWRDPAAMAQVTCGYARKLGAEQVRIVGCGEYIWVRLESGMRQQLCCFGIPWPRRSESIPPWDHCSPNRSQAEKPQSADADTTKANFCRCQQIYLAPAGLETAIYFFVMYGYTPSPLIFWNHGVMARPPLKIFEE